MLLYFRSKRLKYFNILIFTTIAGIKLCKDINITECKTECKTNQIKEYLLQNQIPMQPICESLLIWYTSIEAVKLLCTLLLADLAFVIDMQYQVKQLEGTIRCVTLQFNGVNIEQEKYESWELCSHQDSKSY